MNRRELIRGIGAVICAGSIPTFLPRLIEKTQTMQDAYDSVRGPIILSGGLLSINALDPTRFDISPGVVQFRDGFQMKIGD